MMGVVYLDFSAISAWSSDTRKSVRVVGLDAAQCEVYYGEAAGGDFRGAPHLLIDPRHDDRRCGCDRPARGISEHGARFMVVGTPGPQVLRLFGPNLTRDPTDRLTSLALRRGESPGLKELPNLNVKDLRDALDRGQSDALASACFDVLKVTHSEPCLLGRGLLGPATRKPSAADVGAKGGCCWHPTILASCTLWKHAT